MSEYIPAFRGRRGFLSALAVAPVIMVAQSLPTNAATIAAATPACDDDDEPTPRQTEGPYFKKASPQRNVLREAALAGTPLRLSGVVMSTTCVPIAGVKLDFWQSDDYGDYDHEGYRLRGHQFTDASGRYSLETIVPGLYFGRTRHIHVKAQAPNARLLTTQLYFPGEPRNAEDWIFTPRNVIAIDRVANGLSGRFDFVLASV